jgi:hypothetical protein
MADAGSQVSWVKNSDVFIYRLGYFWFLYGGYAGELQHIRFKKQIFYPINQNVDGYGWDVEVGVSGKFHAVWTKLNEMPIEVISKGISLAAGNLAGLAPIGVNGITDVAPTIAAIASNTRIIASK